MNASLSFALNTYNISGKAALTGTFNFTSFNSKPHRMTEQLR
jgi:hypothetical protein